MVQIKQKSVYRVVNPLPRSFLGGIHASKYVYIHELTWNAALKLQRYMYIPQKNRSTYTNSYELQR